MGSCLLLFVALGGAGWSQEAGGVRIRSWPYQLPPVVIRADVSSVPVEIVVRDRNGLPVGALTEQDFRVWDNGQPRPITSFSVDVRGGLGASAAHAGAGAAAGGSGVVPKAGAAAPRYLELYFDDVSTSDADVRHARAAAEQFIRHDLGAADRAAVLTASGSRVAFTADRARLLAAVAGVRAHPRSAAHSEGCLRITAYQAYLIVNRLDPSALDAAEANRAACEKQSGTSFAVDMESRTAQLGADTGSEFVLATAGAVWAENEATSSNILRSLGAAVDYVAGQPGRRILLLASGGFLAGTLGAQQDEIVEHALRADVTIDALDARGLYVEDPDIPLSEQSELGIVPLAMFTFRVESQLSEQQEREAAMANLALGTGGLIFHDNNDLALGFRRLGLAPSVAYELSFTPNGIARNGKLHKLKVAVVPNRSYTIQARRGYFAPAPEAAGLTELAAQAMRGAGSIIGMPASAAVRPGKRAGKPVETVHLHLAAGELPFVRSGGRERETLLFTVGSFDASGRFLAGKQAEMALALQPQEWKKLVSHGLNADISLPEDARATRIRCIVGEANTGKIYAISLPLR